MTENNEPKKSSLEQCFLNNIFRDDEGYSEYIKSIHGNNFKVTDLKKGTIYIWSDLNKIWKSCDKSLLLQFIPKAIEPKCNIYIQELREEQKLYKEKDDEYQKIENNIKELYKILKHVRNKHGQSAIRDLLMPKLYDEKFVELLNTSEANLDFFPISKNRVIDLRYGKIYPRLKGHYFTHTTNLDLDFDDTKRKNVEEFMRKIRMCENENDSEDMYKLCQLIAGSILSGRRSGKNIIVWHGCGDNAKGTFNMIMSKILGDFYCSASKYIFIDHPSASSGSHQNFLSQLRGKRYFNFAELKPTDRLNEGLLKSVCSPVDTINFRTANSDIEQTLRVYGLPSLETNFFPHITLSDNALINRLRIVPCNSKFISNPNPHNKLEFKALSSQELDNFIDSHLNAIFTWCLEGSLLYYNNNCTIDFPSICINYKDNILNDQDHNSYIIDRMLIIHTPSDESKFVTHAQAYQKYKLEIKDDPPQSAKDILSRKNFISHVNSFLKSKNSLFIGFDPKHHDRPNRWNSVSLPL